MLPIKHNWEFYLLWLAGIYNISFGFWAIFFPKSAFEIFGLAVPHYLELWQCLGMIVGVYGLGFIIAAYNPIRYWPIILIAFLGKSFGPIGFTKAIIDQSFPISFGLIILLNDMIWLIPFFFILKKAYRFNSSVKKQTL